MCPVTFPMTYLMMNGQFFILLAMDYGRLLVRWAAHAQGSSTMTLIEINKSSKNQGKLTLDDFGIDHPENKSGIQQHIQKWSK